jgi:hypothetical protein
MSGYAKLTLWLIAAWFALSLGASALHLIENGPNQPPLALGVAALTPILVFALWFAGSASFREFTLALNPRILTMVQSWRIAGFVFLVLAAHDLLPGFFAMSAGWGDIFIGATALLAAFKLATPRRRGCFLLWQALGILDLVTAVLLASLAQVIDPHGIQVGTMTVLPMSLIPTFAVPLFLILHLICIAQALRWPVQHNQTCAQPRHSAAV